MVNRIPARRRLVLLACVCFALSASACAGSLTRRIVALRTAQGDAAVQNHDLAEARKEYALALALSPANAHARQGLAHVLFLNASADFINARLDQAQQEVASALKYAPNDPATQALNSQIEQARIRREIVIANYPLYASVGSSLTASLKSVDAAKRDVEKQLLSFDYDYDTAHLQKAIIESYDLQQDMHRIMLRLVAYRNLVQSGASKPRSAIESETPNLLPIP